MYRENYMSDENNEKSLKEKKNERFRAVFFVILNPKMSPW